MSDSEGFNHLTASHFYLRQILVYNYAITFDNTQRGHNIKVCTIVVEYKPILLAFIHIITNCNYQH